MRAASPPAWLRSGRASPPRPPRVRRFRARSHRTNGRRSCALPGDGCASADCGPAPIRGWNARCRWPAPADRKTAASPTPRPGTTRPSQASATPSAGDPRTPWPSSPVRGRYGTAGLPPRLHFVLVQIILARRSRSPRSPVPRRLPPPPIRPTSRRPDCRRHRPALRDEDRALAIKTKWPRCNWSCPRRSGPPARPYRRELPGWKRDNFENASASGDGCGRASWLRVVAFFPSPLVGEGGAERSEASGEGLEVEVG